MTYQTFTGDPAARRRYWARSHLGWQLVGRAAPNRGPPRGRRAAGRRPAVRRSITQNVDGLHQAAGARDVTDLHGRLDRVRCLDCGRLSAADRAATRGWPRRTRTGTRSRPGSTRTATSICPTARWTASARSTASAAPACSSRTWCSSARPCRADRVAALLRAGGRSRSLLVLGSSLTVMSGPRFVLRAARDGRPVAIVNQGATRGDRYAAVTVDAPLGTVLPAVAARVTGRS